MKKYFIFSAVFLFSAYQLQGQICSNSQTFTWQGASSGNRAIWNTDDTLNIYKNVFGIDVKVEIIDPHKQNTTTQNPSVFNDFTKSNTFYGRGALAFQITAEKPRQDVCLEFSFSKPIILQNFNIGDIDFIADLRHPSGNFQDYITLTSSLETFNVSLEIHKKSNNPNFTIEGQTIFSHYILGTRNELKHTDPDGAVSISSSDYIDKFTICYSNGPADGGPSNGQAMKITEFSFCQKLGNLMGYTLEEGTNKPIPNVQLCLENLDGTPVLDFDGQLFKTQSDANGYYFIDGIPIGNYRIVQTTPEGFKLMRNMSNEPQNFNNSDITYTSPVLENLNFFYELITPLSVNLILWDVEKLGEKVNVVWQTASENQSDYFAISTSLDGINYIESEKIKAQGFSSSLTNYNYEMKHPYTQSYFIQMSQHDFDGSLYHFGTKKIIQKNVNEWAITPNPTNGIVNIKTSLDNCNNCTLSLFDATGRYLFSTIMNHTEESIDINFLPKGVYSLMIYDGQSHENFKVIKL